MAAVLANGESELLNAAREPEVVDVANLLRKMGARIEGEGTSTIRVEGVDSLHGTEHSIIPDRIETGTYLVAGAMLGGELRLPKRAPRAPAPRHREDEASRQQYRDPGRNDAGRAQ